MSLSRLAIRLSTVMALRGRTLAGDAVEDSMIAAFEGFGDSKNIPFLAVYTDDALAEDGFKGRDLTGFGGTLAIVIESGVTARMQIEGERYERGLPETDAGMEMTLDILEREVRIALADDTNPWAELWRSLNHGVAKFRSIRGASEEKTTRFAARQMEITVRPLAEPPIGAEPTGAWAKLLTLMEAEDDLRELAGVLRPLFRGETTATTEQLVRRNLGLTVGEADAMLLATPAGAEAGIAVTSVNASPATPKP